METNSSFRVRKNTLEFTNYLSSHFSHNGRTDLKSICKEEKLSILTDDYQGYFDGMLVWDGQEFNIHLDISKGNTADSKRGRFTLAHELGHYFTEYHREGIKTGVIPEHCSTHSLLHDDRIELEADFFAANLLMPEQRLKALTGRKKFSLDIIKEVSEYFDVSLTAALLRFKDVGTHDIMIVFSRNNIVAWSQRSDKFPKLIQKFKRGSQLPPTSVAGESFRKENAQYTTAEKLELDDWFEDRGWGPGSQLYEQCFYSKQYDFVASLIWFD